MNPAEFLDATDASLAQIGDAVLRVSDLGVLLATLSNEDLWAARAQLIADADDELLSQFALAFSRVRTKVLETRSLAQFGMRQAERSVIGGGIAGIMLGISALVSQSNPLVAILPVIGGAYVAFRGHFQGRRFALLAGRCDAALGELDRLLEGL